MSAARHTMTDERGNVWNIPSSAVRAVGRFNPDGPAGFRAVEPWAKGAPLRATRDEARQDAHPPTHTRPTTAEEWAAFLEHDPLPLPDRLRLVATLANGEREAWPDKVGSAQIALLAIIPGDGQATPAMLDAVAEATGRPRIRQGEDGITNTAPAARAALRRWAARP